MVASYLQETGYRIIPVNSTVDLVLGQKSYPDLKSVPVPTDMLDVFRRSEQVSLMGDEAIYLVVKFVWMQDGVMH